MRFTVEAPDPVLRSQMERGPQHMCWQGDQDCAFYSGGPCTAIECTCELDGRCRSCPPSSAVQQVRRIP